MYSLYNKNTCVILVKVRVFPLGETEWANGNAVCSNLCFLKASHDCSIVSLSKVECA